MEDQSANETEALRMLDLFASVGTNRFDLTRTDRQGEKVKFERGYTLDRLRLALPGLLGLCAQAQQNLIVRPYGSPPVFLIQLDDLDAEKCQRVVAVSFLQLQTSPGNYQTWISLPADAGVDFIRRLRKGTGADPNASGATRVAGSRNFKERYAPDFPLIEIAASSPGLQTSQDQLIALGLVAPIAPQRAASPPRRAQGAGRQWPSYERCVREAPAKRDHSGPDTSRADFTWALIALDWGFSVEATTAQLMELSDKAKTEGERYAARTVHAAEAALARRHGKSHNEP